MAEIVYLPELIQLWHDRFVAQVRRANAGESDEDWFDDYIIFGTADPVDPYEDEDSFPEWNPWIEAVCELAGDLITSQGELPNDWVIFVGCQNEVDVVAKQLEEDVYFPTGVVIHRIYADEAFVCISVDPSDTRKHVFVTDRVNRPEGLADQIFTAIDTGRRPTGSGGEIFWCSLSDSNKRSDWVETEVDLVYRLGSESDFRERGKTPLKIVYKNR